MYKDLENRIVETAYRMFKEKGYDRVTVQDICRELQIPAEKLFISGVLKERADLERILEEHHYLIGNVDATILAQAPKMRPHIDTMRQKIADALQIDISQVSVKATTEEGLGFTGAGEGIAVQAVALISSPMDLEASNPMGGCQNCPVNS